MYLGSAKFHSLPNNSIRLSFDGNGNFNGSVLIENQTTKVDGAYQCLNINIRMTFNVKNASIALIGTFNTEYSIMSGLARYYFNLTYDDTKYIEGTFYFSRI
jgi:hypothetical protein